MLESQARWQRGTMPWERTPNRILAKSELGRTRPITIEVPDDRHFYGQQVPHDDYKAKQVMYDWQNHISSQPQYPPSKNLIQANKSCISNKLHTSTDFYKFRQTHSSIIPKRTQAKGQIKLKLPQQGFTYGKQNKPNDAMRTVLGNGFGLHQSQKLERLYNTRNTIRSMAPRKLSAHMTKSYYLMKNSAQRKMETLNWKRMPESNFKLTKFSTVTHKVDHDRKRPKTAGGFAQQYQRPEAQQYQEENIESSN